MPPSSEFFTLSFPRPHTLLVTINRPNQRNSIPSAGHWDAHAIFSWFDEEPSLLVAIITGEGDKAFCAGQDLTEQSRFAAGQASPGAGMAALHHPPTGFLGLSMRRAKKPVLAAVNGLALGGGFETCLNWLVSTLFLFSYVYVLRFPMTDYIYISDMIVAAPTAQFGLPEVAVGLYAAAGGPARLVRTVGYPLAAELAMTGRRVSAQQALEYRLINRISTSPVEECLALAAEVAKHSPDGVIVTRQALREAWETAGVDQASVRTRHDYIDRLRKGKNFRIGVDAFANKKKPNWVASNL